MKYKNDIVRIFRLHTNWKVAYRLQRSRISETRTKSYLL